MGDWLRCSYYDSCILSEHLIILALTNFHDYWVWKTFGTCFLLRHSVRREGHSTVVVWLAFWVSRMFTARVTEFCLTLFATGIVKYYIILCFAFGRFFFQHVFFDRHIFTTASRVEGHVPSCFRNQPHTEQLGVMTTSRYHLLYLPDHKWTVVKMLVPNGSHIPEGNLLLTGSLLRSRTLPACFPHARCTAQRPRTHCMVNRQSNPLPTNL